MARRSLPTTDSGLLAWSLNFKTLTTADPTAFGLTPALAATYATLHDTYATALLACDPTLRNRTSTSFKNAARTKLRVNARLLMNLINGTAAVTDAQKTELGFALRGAGSPAPIPSAAPGIDLLAVVAWTVKLRLWDKQSTAKRGKPADVIGASLFTYTGTDDTPPTNIDQWKFETITGRSRIDITFPSTLAPGTKVWISAFWFNNRKQSGPVSTPISIHLQGGGVLVTAA